MKDTPLIQICRRIIELCKRAGIKKYPSKYHNRIYTTHQLMVLECIKQKSGAGYEAFIEEELIEMPHVVEFLNLISLPHPDTLNKFAKRSRLY